MNFKKSEHEDSADCEGVDNSLWVIDRENKERMIQELARLEKNKEKRLWNHGAKQMLRCSNCGQKMLTNGKPKANKLGTMKQRIPADKIKVGRKQISWMMKPKAIDYDGESKIHPLDIHNIDCSA